MTSVLIVVDVQNDFCEGGALAVEGGRDLAERIEELIYSAKATNTYSNFVASKDWHIEPGPHFDDWPAHCVPNTWGSEFAPELHPYANPKDLFDAVFYKGQYSDGYSALSGTVDKDGDGYSLLKIFREAKSSYNGNYKIDVVGIALDYCVRATALGLAYFGFDTTVLLDYTVPVAAESVQSVLTEFDTYGVKYK